MDGESELESETLETVRADFDLERRLFNGDGERRLFNGDGDVFLLGVSIAPEAALLALHDSLPRSGGSGDGAFGRAFRFGWRPGGQELPSASRLVQWLLRLAGWTMPGGAAGL